MPRLQAEPTVLQRAGIEGRRSHRAGQPQHGRLARSCRDLSASYYQESDLDRRVNLVFIIVGYIGLVPG